MKNKKSILIGFILAVLVMLVIGAAIDYRALNTSQFTSSGTVSIKSNATVTNLVGSFIGNAAGLTNFNATNANGATVSNSIALTLNDPIIGQGNGKVGSTGAAPFRLLIGAQLATANLTNWSSIATNTKQDTLGYVPETNGAANSVSNVLQTAINTKQFASLNLSNWSSIGTNTKQDTLGYTPSTNSQSGIISALGYTPEKTNNTVSGIRTNTVSILANGTTNLNFQGTTSQSVTGGFSGGSVTIGIPTVANINSNQIDAATVALFTNLPTGSGTVSNAAALTLNLPLIGQGNGAIAATGTVAFLSLIGAQSALGYTPLTNSFLAITNTLGYKPETNGVANTLSNLLQTQIDGKQATLGYVPATNSQAGIVSALGYTPSATNTTVPTNRTITINGTANQITSSTGAQDLNANRTWTLSLPQDITVSSSVTFAGITNTGLTASQFVATDVNKKLVSTLDGSTLTSLAGANITTGTINSNKLDAATLALLNGSGTVNSVSTDTNMSVATATTTPAITFTNYTGTGPFVRSNNAFMAALTVSGVTNNGNYYLPTAAGGERIYLGKVGTSVGIFRTNNLPLAAWDNDLYEYANNQLTFDLLSTNFDFYSPVRFDLGATNNSASGWNGNGKNLTNLVTSQGALVVGAASGGIVTTGILHQSFALTNDATGDVTVFTASNQTVTASSIGHLALLSSTGTDWSSNVFKADSVAANDSLRLSTNGTLYGTFNGDGSALSNLTAANITGVIPSANLPKKTNVILVANFDGNSSAIAVGTKVLGMVAGDNWTISGWAIAAQGTSPTCTIDVWRTASATALPTVADTIMGTKPALATGNVIKSSTLTSWSKSITNGVTWGVNIDACANATNIVFTLFGYR